MQDKKNFIQISLISVIFLLPFLSFLNNNIQEIDIIVGKSFFLLIVIIFLFLFGLAYFLNNFFKKKNLINSFLIVVIGYWLFFNHNLLNNSIKNIFVKLGLGKFEFSSELSLLIIIVLSIFFGFFIYKENVFFKRFFGIFFFLSFSVISFQIFNHYLNTKNFVNDTSNNIVFTDNLNEPKKNIYYFILDGMLPLQEFSEYYSYDTKNFLEFVKKNNFEYKDNTINLYNNTTHGLSAIFYLDEIFDKENNLKKKAKILYPSLLRKNNTSDLLINLSNLNYEFKWLGNFFAYCPKFNLRYCINTNENNLIDTYLYINFFRQSPLIQIIINLGYLVNFEFNKYFFIS